MRIPGALSNRRQEAKEEVVEGKGYVHLFVWWRRLHIPTSNPFESLRLSIPCYLSVDLNSLLYRKHRPSPATQDSKNPAY
jgi:hypothetical protein